MFPAASRSPSLRWLSVLVLLLLAAGCADKRPAPIVDHTQPGVLREDERYVVLRGDTLFAIAFRFGLDFRRLAAANAIAAPYTIYPGQVLRLAEAELPVVSTPPQRQAPPAQPGNKTSLPAAVPAGGKPAAKQEPAGAITASRPATRPSVVPATGDWRWPAEGRISRRFETDLHKGLDISGERGDPVRATASGTVVYAGSGIAGYGLMLIIRHSDEYLSAYGHNDALLVDEGESVLAGQDIARRGSSGTDSVKLHFEIRRRGRPVDPLQLLPRR